MGAQERILFPGGLASMRLTRVGWGSHCKYVTVYTAAIAIFSVQLHSNLMTLQS